MRRREAGRVGGREGGRRRGVCTVQRLSKL